MAQRWPSGNELVTLVQLRRQFVIAAPPNGSRLSCGALKKDSFHNLRAPLASSACYAARPPDLMLIVESIVAITS